VSTPNTASNFISAINQSYPTAGQDNNSQGFRNNFKNIKQALSWIDTDVYDLQLNGVKKTENNNFNNNIIEKATFKDCAITVFDDSQTVRTGDVVVDYEKGNYQKFKVSAGLHTFTFVNWPDFSKSGKLTLSIISDNTVGSTVDFGAVTVNNLGTTSFPMNISGTFPNVFEVWNEGDANTIFVYGYDPIGNESSLPLSIESLSIGTNTYSTVTNTYAKYATSVKANNKAGNISLVPNKILCTVANASLINVDPGTLTATGFKVNSTNGLMVNSTCDLPLSTNLTKYNVTALTADTITVTPPFEITAFNIGDVITFVNPTFNDQPTVVTFKPTAQTTTTSVPNDLKGTVYASSTTLYMSHSDYLYNKQGWIKLSADHVPKQLVDGSTAVTQPSNDDSTKIATTEFVKNSVDAVFAVPAGGIILWSGSISNIPAGWSLCNGANGTPDLRDRFVVGAGNTYAAGSSGGSLTTGNSGDHNHGGTNTTELTVSNAGWSTGGGAPGTITQGTLLAGSGNLEVNEVLESIRAANSPLSIGSHSHNIPNSGNHNHSILPPYYALCYIMKL
jgi:hypothetical protein